jgi:hypothetical protein
MCAPPGGKRGKRKKRKRIELIITQNGIAISERNHPMFSRFRIACIILSYRNGLLFSR